MQDTHEAPRGSGHTAGAGTDHGERDVEDVDAQLERGEHVIPTHDHIPRASEYLAQTTDVAVVLNPVDWGLTAADLVPYLAEVNHNSEDSTAVILALAEARSRTRIRSLNSAVRLLMANENPSSTRPSLMRRAVETALRASDTKQLGRSLALLAGAARRTQGEIVRRDSGEWLSKSTVSRMMNGAVLCRHRQQVEAFVKACVGADSPVVDLWGQAWEQVRENQAIRRENLALTEGNSAGVRVDDEADQYSAATQTVVAEDVLLDVHIRVTEEHIRKAVPMLFAMGLCDANENSQNGWLLASKALLGAAGVALLNHAQRLAQACGTVDVDSAGRLAGVCSITAPSRRTA